LNYDIDGLVCEVDIGIGMVVYSYGRSMMKKIDFWKKEERESEERESSGKRERRFGR
jgi:hypothetical protein